MVVGYSGKEGGCQSAGQETCLTSCRPRAYLPLFSALGKPLLGPWYGSTVGYISNNDLRYASAATPQPDSPDRWLAGAGAVLLPLSRWALIGGLQWVWEETAAVSLERRQIRLELESRV